MRRTFVNLLVLAALGLASVASAQTRSGGFRRLQLDDNAGNNAWLTNSLGSVGLDNAGLITGTFPKTNAMLTLLPGAKTFGLVIDGGSTWSLDITNASANSIRTGGRTILGDGVGADPLTVNLGTGDLTVVGIAAPALPAPFNNLLYLNGLSQVRQTAAGVNVVTGNGTFLTHAMWTPDGFKLGDSYISQSSNAAGGTLTVSERTTVNSTVAGNMVTINNFNNASTALKINANGGTGVFVDPASIGIQLDATATGISYVNSNPTTGISLRASTTGINFANSPVTGIDVSATTTGVFINGAPTTGLIVNGGTATGIRVNNQAANGIGMEILRVSNNNNSLSGYDYTQSVSTATTTHAFRAQNSSVGTITNGMTVSNTGAGAITNGLRIENTGAGTITAGINVSGAAVGVVASAVSTTAAVPIGGDFSASGSSTSNVGLSASAVGGGSPINIAATFNANNGLSTNVGVRIFASGSGPAANAIDVTNGGIRSTAVATNRFANTVTLAGGAATENISNTLAVAGSTVIVTFQGTAARAAALGQIIVTAVGGNNITVGNANGINFNNTDIIHYMIINH